MLRITVLVAGFLLCHSIAFCTGYPNPVPFKLVRDGVIIYPDPDYTLNTQAVKLRVVADNIIQVTASPAKELAPFQSLSAVETTPPAPNSWKVITTKDRVTVKTRLLTAVVLLRTGAVSFYDTAGRKVLAEKGVGGRSFSPIAVEGQRSYQITQVFQTTPDDAYYGLGQHQDDVFNYKGHQVTLFQNNTEVAVPFLVSHKNYGLLWDNYSITSIGDIRPYHSLSALQLFSDKGEPGWLTASYYNDRGPNATPVKQRAETAISYEFLNDSRLFFPPDFLPTKGKVVWEGSIASEFQGLHKFRMTYGGYIKVWVEGKLVLDRWRRAWNPAPALLDLPLDKGKKYAIRIEWAPESVEAYLTLRWIEPLPAEAQDQYAFASEAGQQLNYYFIYGGTMDEIIAGYRTLTGKASLVPKWALGFWQSRERYKTQDEILSTVKEFRDRQLPLDNIVLDWSYWKEDDWGSQEFDAARFPNPDSMIKVLHEQYHTKFMISVWPKFYEGISAYKTFDQNGWLYKRNIADRTRDWIGDGYTSTFYDAFNEKARKAFWDLINEKIFKKGVDAWWMDASEPDIHSNVSPDRRKQQMAGTAIGPAAEYLNAYPLQNAKGIYEGQRSADPDKRVFLLTRSGYAGSQRYAATIWSGDIGARWDDMKAQITAGINFSLSGLPWWSMDIGGFVVENRFEYPNEKDQEEWREMLTRWYQFGSLTPVYRSHGQFPYREPFNIAPEDHPAYKSILYYTQLRYRLMPYIYSIAGKSYHEDYTLMRGLPMDFAGDTAVLRISDQYMFGPSLLVNPVYRYGQRNKELYLPKGQGWYNLYTGQYEPGGRRINAAADYGQMPVYVKEGAILPVGPSLQYTEEKLADTITLYVYTGKNASFNLYEDENNNYNYEKGLFASIPLSWNEATKTLSVGARKGSFPGMLVQRHFRVIRVSPGKPVPMDPGTSQGQLITYTGKAVTLKPE
ncbi:MAG: glycoside hydrolase family 31 protein [Candidatus Pseudobacter hemicellulosilyticus]|uniref:Glycoside hydrolase family 31 protein n=1 Tax=Candidatus Pseudobacter hemicellulosilyticus TaxID=3121375 RepID=A0AAJ6BE74_9BACT|nr:MAG: glycoside hydrolase family 31 protein [Pseudobacter sp.]